MTVDLSEIEFENDMFSITLKSGNVLLLININEEPVNYKGIETAISRILIFQIDSDGNQTQYPNIIGLTTEEVSVTSDYEDLQGVALCEDNLTYCTLDTGDL